jgi:hypothetical protein
MSLRWPFALLILLLPIAVIIYKKIRRKIGTPVFVSEVLSIATLPSYKKIRRRSKRWNILEQAVLWLFLGSLALLFARPVSTVTTYNEEKSRDIVLCLDVSTSMDKYIPEALDSMESIAKQNPGDRYSIVIFAGRAFPILPLTRDQVAIKDKIALLRSVYKDGNDPNYHVRSLVGGGTDLGEGIRVSVARFSNLDSYKSRSIILLSDLVQTGGDFDKNSEHFLDKVGLLPKYRINFYVLQAPADFYDPNNEIVSIGGGQAFEVTANNFQSSEKSLLDKIFKQILNTDTVAGKNIVDYPYTDFIFILLALLLWQLVVLFRWRRS